MNNSKKIGNEGERQVANVLFCLPSSNFKLYNNVMFKTKGVLEKRYYCDCAKSKICIECSHCYMDYSNSLRAKLEMANESISSKASKKIKFGNKFAVDSLIVGLTLSEDEIRSYNCEFCDDSRQKIIANPDAGSIKLS